VKYTVFQDDAPLIDFDESELRALLAAGEYGEGQIAGVNEDAGALLPALNKLDAILHGRVSEYLAMVADDA